MSYPIDRGVAYATDGVTATTSYAALATPHNYLGWNSASAASNQIRYLI